MTRTSGLSPLASRAEPHLTTSSQLKPVRAARWLTPSMYHCAWCLLTQSTRDCQSTNTPQSGRSLLSDGIDALSRVSPLLMVSPLTNGTDTRLPSVSTTSVVPCGAAAEPLGLLLHAVLF